MTHGTTGYRHGCRCKICAYDKAQYDYNYMRGNMDIPKCMVPECKRPQALAMNRGLCMVCYSRAKKLVDTGKTTWDVLVDLQLALPTDDPFTAAFKERNKT